MKRVLSTLGYLLICVGMVLCMLPWISDLYSRYCYNKTNDEFEQSTVDENNEPKDYSELIKTVKEYNQKIYETGQEDLQDPFDYETSSIDLSKYGIEDDLIGTIWIPRLNVELPLIWGSSHENMAKGATLMGQTSFPLGENNSHSVIAAHRGFGLGHPMFRNIQDIQVGDKIQIKLPWTYINYTVESTEVINPDDIDAIRIQDNDNMITLSTCHPYRHNYLRYLVNASFSGYSDVATHSEDRKNLTDTQENEDVGTDISNKYIYIEDRLPYVGIALFIIMSIKTYRRFKHEKNH